MLNKIFILTCGRSASQITYHNLSPNWKEKTVLVVQEKEAHLFEQYPLLVLPPHIQTIAPTREWIVKQHLDMRFAVLDDDLLFRRTTMGTEDGVPQQKMSDTDFDACETLFCSWMDEGIPFCGMDASWNPPDRIHEYKSITRITGNSYFDGPKIPAYELKWTDLEFSEDLYIILQLLSLGIENRASNRYRIDTIATASIGGCSNTRTLEKSNRCMEQLRDLYPGVVQLYEKVVTGGQWKGQSRLAAKIAWKKAFKPAVATNNLQQFFG